MIVNWNAVGVDHIAIAIAISIVVAVVDHRIGYLGTRSDRGYQSSHQLAGKSSREPTKKKVDGKVTHVFFLLIH